MIMSLALHSSTPLKEFLLSLNVGESGGRENDPSGVAQNAISLGVLCLAMLYYC